MTDKPKISSACVVRSISQATNRSLAGTRVYTSPEFLALADSHFASVADEWGLRLNDDTSSPIHLYPSYAQVDGEKISYDPAQKISHDYLDASEQIKLAYAGMPVVRRTTDGLVRSGLLNGQRIAVSLIIEPKTAVLLLELQRAGAEVAVYATASEVHQKVADELKTRGIRVYADSRWTADQEHAGALQLLDNVHPTLIIDDGASFARLVSMERPELISHLCGVAEETTSGVRAFEAMEKSGALSYPVIASNDSQLKTSFDNVHGTGESCVTTLLHVMGDDYAQKVHTLAVIGFGPVGRGFARRMRSLGANVVIVERSATAALKAQYEGFEVMPLKEAIRLSDCIISATGVRHTINIETLQSLNDGTVIGVIGGILNEIALDDLTALTHQHIEPAVELIQLDLSNGRHAQLIASGDGMNYTISGGNPIEIMDMSFSVQLNAVRMLVHEGGKLGNHVIRMNAQIDEDIARQALYARGAHIDKKREMVTDWTTTRFSDAARTHGVDERR